MKKYNDKILKEMENIKEIFNEPIKIINEGTKEYNYIYNNVNNYYDGLRACYNSYSYYKERAYNKYLDIYRKCLYNGYDWDGFGISSYNQNQFTLCMELKKDNINYKIYITKCYNKIIAYKEDEEED